jgi:hypothetical protein
MLRVGVATPAGHGQTSKQNKKMMKSFSKLGFPNTGAQLISFLIPRKSFSVLSFQQKHQSFFNIL